MKRIVICIIIAVPLCLVALVTTIKLSRFNPFDPPHYATPLSNGLCHFSNGGERGWFGPPFVNNVSKQIYPVEDEWNCNEFAVISDDVIGVEIQYAERAHVDPPVARRWFYLDTKDRTATTFDSVNALREHCKLLGHAKMPEFIGRTSETYRLDVD